MQWWKIQIFGDSDSPREFLAPNGAVAMDDCEREFDMEYGRGSFARQMKWIVLLLLFIAPLGRAADPCGFLAKGVKPAMISVALQQPEPCHIHLSQLGVLVLPERDALASGVSAGLNWEYHGQYFVIQLPEQADYGSKPLPLEVVYVKDGQRVTVRPRPAQYQGHTVGMVQSGPGAVLAVIRRDDWEKR